MSFNRAGQFMKIRHVTGCTPQTLGGTAIMLVLADYQANGDTSALVRRLTEE